MSLVLQLRSERAKLNDELQALAKKEAGGEALAAADLERFAQLETQIADLSAKEREGKRESAANIKADSAKNIAVIATIMVIGIGGNYTFGGNIPFFGVQIPCIAGAAVFGILLNALLSIGEKNTAKA